MSTETYEFNLQKREVI